MNPIPALALAVFTLGFGALRGGDGLTREEYQELHASLMQPEKWETIPWRSSLLEARTQSLKEKKPLFLWVMDAKPLGSV
jgi:hypothetical protein